MIYATVALIFLASGAPEADAAQNKEPPAATFQGPSSSRLAAPAKLNMSPNIKDEVIVVRQGKPGSDYGTSAAPVQAIRSFGLSTARRHFEDAEWLPEQENRGKKVKKKKAKGPRYEVVITRITVEAAVGPTYNVIVEVDRVEKGRRRGSATGRGFAMPDRTNQRRAAMFAPGLLGAVASNKASRPMPEKDAAVIEQATVRAFDSALLQLAAVWAGEQYVEELRKKSR